MDTGKGSRHFLNPSNFGITLTLLLYPWVGIAPPYHFTENLDGAGDWILPGFIICAGTFLNARFTHRLPLVAAWLTGFITQASLRSYWNGTPLTPALLPMTGVAFLLFTFYMVTDPATTPVRRNSQIAFGLSMAAAYGLLVSLHIVFGLFFGLTMVCAGRGVFLALAHRVRQSPSVREPAERRAAEWIWGKALTSLSIVGMACRFPDAQSPVELWENVLARRQAFRRIPAERLRLEDDFSTDRAAPD